MAAVRFPDLAPITEYRGNTRIQSWQYKQFGIYSAVVNLSSVSKSSLLLQLSPTNGGNFLFRITINTNPKQEIPPMAGQRKTLRHTSHIPRQLQSIITCSGNVCARPCVNLLDWLECDNNTKSTHVCNAWTTSGPFGPHCSGGEGEGFANPSSLWPEMTSATSGRL